MKKVELQYTPSQLNSLVHSFNFIGIFQQKTRREKVYQSILFDLIIKLKKKHVETESVRLNPFSKKNKKSKITLKLYEADCLEQFLILAEQRPLNEYDRNVLLYFINKLNQQLA